MSIEFALACWIILLGFQCGGRLWQLAMFKFPLRVTWTREDVVFQVFVRALILLVLVWVLAKG